MVISSAKSSFFAFDMLRQHQTLEGARSCVLGRRHRICIVVRRYPPAVTTRWCHRCAGSDPLFVVHMHIMGTAREAFGRVYGGNVVRNSTKCCLGHHYFFKAFWEKWTK